MYTEQFGRASYLVSRNRGKKSLLSKALSMPLAVLEMEVEHLPKRDLHKVRECRLCFPITQLCCHPVKSMIALFLAEVLYRSLKEPEADAALFDYLYQSVQLLEQVEAGLANFHVVFLLGLLSHLGIFPNVTALREGLYFDLQEGQFTDRQPNHPQFLTPNESRVLARLLKISYENMSLYAFSRHDRIQILHHILDYYRLHLPDFPDIKSLDVLQALFD